MSKEQHHPECESWMRDWRERAHTAEDENDRMRSLLSRVVVRVDCVGPSTDPCIRCQIERTLGREWSHTYPDGISRPGSVR